MSERLHGTRRHGTRPGGDAAARSATRARRQRIFWGVVLLALVIGGAVLAATSEGSVLRSAGAIVLLTGVIPVVAVALLAGIYTRLAAYGAGSLLTCFALAMATGLGIRSPLDYSVFVDAAGAWLLAAAISYDRRMAVAELARPAAAGAKPTE